MTKEQQAVLDSARAMALMFSAEEKAYLVKGGAGPVAQEFFGAVEDLAKTEPLKDVDARALLDTVSKRGFARSPKKKV